jgi:hypothetical protein
MAEGKQVALWVGIGCGIAGLIAVIGAVLCVGVCAGGVFVATEMPVRASQDFLNDIKNNQVDTAYNRMSETYRGAHDIESFRAAVARYPALAQHRSSTFMQRNIQHTGVPRATIGGHLTTPSGNVPIQFQLTQTGENYVVDSVMIQGQALQ